MLIIIIVLALIAMIGLIHDRLSDGYSSGDVIAVVFGALFAVSLIGCFVISTESRVFVRKFKEAKRTIETSHRQTLENAALVNSVVELNSSLIEWQWDNSTWYNGFIVTDEVDTLKPIQ